MENDGPNNICTDDDEYWIYIENPVFYLVDSYGFVLIFFQYGSKTIKKGQ